MIISTNKKAFDNIHLLFDEGRGGDLVNNPTSLT
jgi:hypothetical protein